MYCQSEGGGGAKPQKKLQEPVRKYCFSKCNARTFSAFIPCQKKTLCRQECIIFSSSINFHFKATLPPEEDLQIYKWSLVRFRNINASGSRINCGQIATFKPKNSPKKNIGITTTSISIERRRIFILYPYHF